MSTPFPQSSLDQAARDAAANKPQSILDKWKSKIMEMPGFQKPAPAPTSSQAQTVRDAQAAKDAIKKLNAGSTAVSLAGGSVAAAVTAPLMLGGSEDRSRKWSRLGYSSPEAYQKAISQNANRERPIDSNNPASPTGGIMGGLPADYKETEASAFASAARHRGEMADIRGGGGDVSRQIFKPDETRRNGNDVEQTGRDFSGGVSAAFVPEYANSSFNDLLAAQGNQRYQPFNSSQVATAAANPFEGTDPKTDTFNPAAPGLTGNSYDNSGSDGGVAAASMQGREEFVPMTGNESRIEGGTDRPKAGSLEAELADKEGINSYMSKFSGGSRERAARRAFLDAKGGLEGLQARDAVNDMVYAGGQHYGRDGDATFEVNRADARAVASGKTTADALLKTYKDSIVKSGSETPAELQDPAIAGKEFRTDSGITASDPVSQASALESKDFSLNNDDGGGFGAPKGYKAQSSYKDPAFPNPFKK